ncbi:potassium channel subfamily K member 6 [Takifugu rubripes]|uniref:Potassium channel subfamily K member n=1 Tax=Takifugu rubripes TaxID=31033 RepID=H2S9A3_TAKRU|nr:potassium channel subfamily K member 1-like [Takifugu rubripes]
MRSSGKSWLLLTGCVVFYVIYLLFGALVFSTIERPMEEKLLQELEVLKQEFLNESCASPASLERLLVKALAASRSGVSVLGNSSSPSNWDLASSMFFANTLVTTVGYGNTTPLSATGKAFSIVYALIGVPFTMLVLTVCVQKLLYPLVIAPIGLLHRLGMRLRPATLVHFLLLMLLVILGFFVAPAAIFSTLEVSWSFLDGIYFCFISLCTIGLGDFVPATQLWHKYRQLYQIGIMVYLFMGLMMMYLLLRTLHKMADLHGLTTFLQLPRCEESDQDEDREPIVETERDAVAPYPVEKTTSEALDPGSQSSYNTINKD